MRELHFLNSVYTNSSNRNFGMLWDEKLVRGLYNSVFLNMVIFWRFQLDVWIAVVSEWVGTAFMIPVFEKVNNIF